jgi:putative phage-type endonuclease
MMKKIEVEQGSPSWLSWRKTVITATDCPAILGSSPWSTTYQCWQRKLGLLEEQKVNDAMERGKRLEPEARSLFTEQTGITMAPVVVESDEFDFLGASLDGLSDCGKYVLEIKCGGSRLHNMAAQREIPDYYQDQIQHQLLVTGAEKCFYYSYNGSDGICIVVLPDPDFKNKFMPKAREFWKCVAFSEPPVLCDDDYQDMFNDPEWKAYAIEYRNICEKIKALEASKENYRKEILNLCADQNCVGHGIKVVKTTMKGRISYEDIPEVKSLDLDKYRKSPTVAWKIMVT